MGNNNWKFTIFRQGGFGDMVSRPWRAPADNWVVAQSQIGVAVVKPKNMCRLTKNVIVFFEKFDRIL